MPLLDSSRARIAVSHECAKLEDLSTEESGLGKPQACAKKAPTCRFEVEDFANIPGALAAGIVAAMLAVVGAGDSGAAQRSGNKPDAPAQVEIVKADILDSEDGYPIPPDSVFFPGETVHLRFRLDGYTRGEYDRIKLSWRIDSFGPMGDRFTMAEGGAMDSELAPQDKDWQPIIRHSPTIPAHAGAGNYRVVLKVVDELNQAHATSQMVIRVKGQEILAENQLIVRNFVFTKVEGGEPLTELVFEPGETLWATFYITGFQISADNSFDVHAELRLADQKGKVLFTFDPQEEQGSPFYPRRWLPANFQLDLDEDVLPGQYSIVLFLEDRLGDQSLREEKPFRVRAR